MKTLKLSLLAVSAAMFLVLALAGCAGIKTTDESDLQLLKNTNTRGVIYYKLAYYKAGMTQWTYVGNAPEPRPYEELVKFKKMFIDETVEIMKKNEFTMVEVDKNPGDGLFIEIRIAGINPIPFLQEPMGATRWYIFHPALKSPVEIYRFDFTFSAGFGALDDKIAKSIAQKVVGDFLSLLGKQRGEKMVKQ